MNNHRLDFECEELGNGIYRINEFDFANAYLVVGEDKAALLDCGVGIGQMAEFVRTLTDKEITVLATHTHADHVGGAVWFKEIHVHPNDFKWCRFDVTQWSRMYFLHQHPYKRKMHHVRFRDAWQGEYKPAVKALNEGDIFDLGGRSVEVFFTPGHSTGHVTFRDSQTGTLFTGDNVNPLVTLHFPNCTTVEEWKEGALRTLSLAGTSPIYGGHGDGRITREMIEENLANADEILKQPNSKKSKIKKMSQGAVVPSVLYKTDKIHKI